MNASVADEFDESDESDERDACEQAIDINSWLNGCEHVNVHVNALWAVCYLGCQNCYTGMCFLVTLG